MLFKNKYWIQSSAYTMLSRILSVLFGFGSFYMLVRIFPKDEFGAWVLYISVAAFVEITRNGILQNSFVKFSASKNKEEFSEIFYSSAVLNIGISLFSIVVLFFASPFLSAIWSLPQLKELINLYMIMTLVLIPFSQFGFVQQARMDFKGIFISTAVRQGLFFVYVLLAFLMNHKLELNELIYVQIISSSIASFVSFLYARTHIDFEISPNFDWVKKLFAYGKYVFGTSIGSTIFNTIDQMMLGIFAGPASVALYNASMRIVNIIEVPINSLAAIVLPQSTVRVEKNGLSEAKYLYEKSVGVVLAIVLPVIIIGILFPKTILLIIAGAEYSEASTTLSVICVYSFFFPFGRQFGIILDSIGKAKVNFASIVFMISVNIIANYVFINHFGLIGAAFGTLTATGMTFLLNQYLLWKIVNVNVLNVFAYAVRFYQDILNKMSSVFMKRFKAIGEQNVY